MDYQELEKEFDRILSLPLWQRPIALSELAKKLKIPQSSIKRSFDNFWNQRLREHKKNQAITNRNRSKKPRKILN